MQALNQAEAAPQLWSAKKVAETIGVHEITVFHWSREGKFPKPVRRGRKFTRWRSDDVLAWMNALESS